MLFVISGFELKSPGFEESTPLPLIRACRNFLRSFLKKMGHSRPLFSLFSSIQYTVDSKQMFNINKFLLVTGFKLGTSGIGSDRSTN